LSSSGRQEHIFARVHARHDRSHLVHRPFADVRRDGGLSRCETGFPSLSDRLRQFGHFQVHFNRQAIDVGVLLAVVRG
jgi:hypothetical protein